MMERKRSKLFSLSVIVLAVMIACAFMTVPSVAASKNYKNVYQTTNGKTTVKYVTNGTYRVYLKRTYDNRDTPTYLLRQKTVKTGKVRTLKKYEDLADGLEYNFAIRKVYSNVLYFDYCGYPGFAEAQGSPDAWSGVYSYNLSTGETHRYLHRGIFASSGKYVYTTSTNVFLVDNELTSGKNCYIVRLNKGKLEKVKKMPNTYQVKARKGKFYYRSYYKNADGKKRFRFGRCDANGSHNKKLFTVKPVKSGTVQLDKVTSKGVYYTKWYYVKRTKTQYMYKFSNQKIVKVKTAKF